MSSGAVTRNEACTYAASLLTVTLLLALVPVGETAAQWAAGPGETVRNSFGYPHQAGTAVCRGACGRDCPSSCDREIRYECAPGDRLLRVQTMSCGTHPACREHDDCLDRCASEHAEGYDCQAECHAEVMSLWPIEQAASWAAGGGPFEGEPILFEYTKDQPGGPEAFYRCPEQAQLQCSEGQAVCLAGGASVAPVFAGYEGSGAGSMRVANFQSGTVCTRGGKPTSVCQGAVDIEVTGEDRCAQADGDRPCTWYGFEFDYRGAVPGEPLYCSSSGIKGDFLGGIVTGALKSADADNAINDEFGELLGGVQKELNKGKSLDQALSGITITTADGQTLGGKRPVEAFASPGVPGEVAVNTPSGHLLVPMFELQGEQPSGSSVEHHIRCLQAGRPVIETTFRLSFTGGGDTGSNAEGVISGSCDCACANRGKVDELCEFFCEEEFSSCPG